MGRYLKENSLPYHPLWDKGYLSIGDWHTTRSLAEVDSVEELRFFDLKRECGMHEDEVRPATAAILPSSKVAHHCQHDRDQRVGQRTQRQPGRAAREANNTPGIDPIEQ